MPRVKYVLLDCDNTLVLSERLAFEACADLTNEIMEKHKISERYTTDSLLEDFVGQNFRGVVKGMETKYNFTLTDEERESYVKMEEDRVIATLKAKAQPCLGCSEELEKLSKSKKYGLAVVSSSALRRVVASVEKVDQAKYFPKDHIFSAATSLPTPTTKPDPAIYLWACEKIGVKPSECVAVEDSKSGTLSAVRAGIITIAYVGSYHDQEKAKEVADMLVSNGAKVVMNHWSEFEKCMAEIEAM